MSVVYKRNEDKIIEGIKAYVDETYSQHYMGSSNRDVVDDWEDCGIAKEAFQSNIIKYAKRFGKKATLDVDFQNIGQSKKNLR